MSTPRKKHFGSAAKFLLTLTTAVAIGALFVPAVTAPALAQDSGGGQKTQTQAGPGGGSGGHDSETHEEGHDSGGGHDSGEEHDGGGGQGGQHDPLGGNMGGSTVEGRGEGGGGPVWSHEGIPEVELGRLNVARSPDHVLARALEEAKASFSPAVAAFYRQDLDQMIDKLSLEWDDVQFIDSPLQNLALLKDALTGDTVLRDVGITTNLHVLEAVFLGTASDKEMPISPATAFAVAKILGHPISVEEAEALAYDAERIRIAILAGHG